MVHLDENRRLGPWTVVINGLRVNLACARQVLFLLVIVMTARGTYITLMMIVKMIDGYNGDDSDDGNDNVDDDSD